MTQSHNGCLTLTDMDRLARQAVDDQECRQLESHIRECPRCAEEYTEFKNDAKFLENAEHDLRAALVSPETVTTAMHTPGSTTPEHLPRVEGYEINRVLGRGGMAVVYEAVQAKLDRPVALKLLPAVAGSASPQLVARFKREATAAARLHHTHIVPIYDFGESRDGYYYAMELIRGHTLRDLIKRLAAANAPEISAPAIAALLHGSQPSADSASSEPSAGFSAIGSSGPTGSSSRGRVYYRQVARWIADVADGLHYAHINGVIHRDVKPSNLILSIDGRLMIADFGLAKVDDDHSVTMSGSLLGTYRYMSPEQVSGAKRLRIDQRTDVYSLGATLYEMLTFQPAYRADNREELLGEIVFNEPTPPRKIIPAVPVELQTICQKAMEKSPEKRYADARDMAEDLRRYINDLPIVAKAPTIIGRARKFVGRRPALSALIAMLVVSGVTVTSLALTTVSARQQTASAQRAEIDAHLRRAGTAFAEGRYQESAEAYGKVLDAEPANIKAMHNLANAMKMRYYETDNVAYLARAEELIERGLAMPKNPHRRAFLNFRAVLLRNRDEFDAAIETLEEVIELDESEYAPWCNLGFTYVLMDDFDSAERAWRKSIARVGEGRTHMTWCNLGALLIYRNDPAAAEALAPAYAARPDDVHTLLHLSRMHLEVDELRNPREALRYAYSADTIGENTGKDITAARVKRVVAQAELANEHWQDAIDAAEAALDGGDEPAAFAHAILAAAYARSGDAAEAAAQLTNLDRTWPEQLRTKGYLATREGGFLVWIDSKRVLEQLRELATRPATSSD